jgi:hypothetical protein
MEREALERSSSTAPEVATRPYFSLSDLIFVLLAAVVGVAVVQLGYVTWMEGRNTEAAKSSGESMVEWMTAESTKRSSSAPDLASECSGEDKNWLNCREWMVSSSGPLKGLSNQLRTSNKLFSAGCDRTQLDTLGSIIVEKGTPKPPDGASLVYAPLADDEPLGVPLSLRLSICGRSFSVIHVAEFTF